MGRVTIVLDASALLASFRGEAGSEIVRAHSAEAVIGAVNFAEVVGKLADLGLSPARIAMVLEASPMPVIAPDRAVALTAGLLRPATRAAGLSLGDRFCIALALRLKIAVLTADRSWTKVADQIGVEVRLIR